MHSLLLTACFSTLYIIHLAWSSSIGFKGTAQNTKIIQITSAYNKSRFRSASQGLLYNEQLRNSTLRADKLKGTNRTLLLGEKVGHDSFNFSNLKAKNEREELVNILLTKLARVIDGKNVTNAPALKEMRKANGDGLKTMGGLQKILSDTIANSDGKGVRKGVHQGWFSPRGKFGQLIRVKRSLAAITHPHDHVCRHKRRGRPMMIRCPLQTGQFDPVCVAAVDLCNGRLDCPNHEDEHPVICLFYRMIVNQLRQIVHSSVFVG